MKHLFSTWFSNKFGVHKWNFIWQPLLAATFVVVALVGLGGFRHVTLLGYIGTSSLGSTAFLVFGMPQSDSASAKNMWGGYIISIMVGVLATLILHAIWSAAHPDRYFVGELTATFAMALTMLIMALFRMEHPPAVGLALGLVVEPWTFYTLTIILLTVCLMTLIKRLLRRWLVDLL